MKTSNNMKVNFSNYLFKEHFGELEMFFKSFPTPYGIANTYVSPSSQVLF